MTIKAPKKLIEVALPLDDINAAAAREKSIRHGHPSTLHLWWARRPLAVARAVLFAQLVNDPGGERGYYAGKTKEQAATEREELFEIIRDLVQWENTNNEEVLERARAAIRKSWRETCELNKGKPGFDPDKLPAFHDPFAGGGSIPLEAQRLGLEAYASDLNPVAVLINKAMIEIPPKFANRPPVGPLPPGESPGTLKTWTGAQGLAEDVRRYGAWMREEAFKRIGHLYPKVDLDTGLPVRHGEEKPGQKTATVIAWIWARTVKSPNPAYAHVDVPLVASFCLSAKPGREVWVHPVARSDGSGYDFVVREGERPPLVETINRRGGVCLMSGTPVDFKYIRAEGKAGRMGTRLMAVVAEGSQGRIYIAATPEMERVAAEAQPIWRPDLPLPKNPRDFKTPNYGMATFGDLFTPRQLIALTTFSDLVQEARMKVRTDAAAAGWTDDGVGLDSGGTGATAYADATATYLAIAVDRAADAWSSLASWTPQRETLRNTFARQALPMVWDYTEANPFSASCGNWSDTTVAWVHQAITHLPLRGVGLAQQADASTQSLSISCVVSTDPPYYDNIGYADLSDYFYVWLRRLLQSTYPSLFATIAVPKAEELIASPYRLGTREAAESFFMTGMTRALRNLAEQCHPATPITIYYAFKQSETSASGTASTGWESFLAAVVGAGFSVTGTWPVRTERSGRTIENGTNALASSIVLVCRKRDADAPTISRREFIRELKEVLPEALHDMTVGSVGRSPVSAVDLAQAIIGPGMGVFSKYAAVLEADGSPMRVHTALTLINNYLPGDPDELDADTRFCLAWFEEYGWNRGPFGQADVLARAKGTSVDHLAQAGVVEAGGGVVRLLTSADYPADWSPELDKIAPAWEATHQLIRALRADGELAAGRLLAGMPERGQIIHQLAYRLYTLCDRKGWAEEARAYNELVDTWGGIEQASSEVGRRREQLTMGFDEGSGPR